MSKLTGRCGCVGCISGILGFIFAMIFTIPTALGIWQEDTWLVPGDSENFDVLATFSEVEKHAGDNVQLISIDAYYVRSDGTLDLKADYNPYVNYTFVRESDPPDDAPPVGAGGNPDNVWYERIDVEITRPWQNWRVTSSSSEYSYYNLGMDKDTYDPTATIPGEIVPAPTCSFAELWEKAIQRDAPRSAVATIEYDSNGYRFSISGTPYTFRFGFECNLRDS